MKYSVVFYTLISNSLAAIKKNQDYRQEDLLADEFIESHRGLWNRQMKKAQELMPDTVSNPLDRIGMDRAALEAAYFAKNNPFAGRLTLPEAAAPSVNRADRFPDRLGPNRGLLAKTTKITKATSTIRSTTATTASYLTTPTTTGKSRIGKIRPAKNLEKAKLSKKEKKALQRKQRRNKLKQTLDLVRSGGKTIKKRKPKKHTSFMGARSFTSTDLGTLPIEEMATIHTFKGKLVEILKKTYVEGRQNIIEIGENHSSRSTSKIPLQPDENQYCSTSTESMGKDLEGTKCPPGQVWAYNKNPRCSLSFSDAVYEIASPDCPYPPSATSEYACVCPCKRPYMLTFTVDFKINFDEENFKTLDTECQLCRSERQILSYGLNLSPMDIAKCERTVRRETKQFLNHENAKNEQS